jgi:phosphatidylinositol alpha 1,6-mannosyltransferase
LIRHGENGLLFEPGRPGSLREAVAHLLQNPESRAAMAAAGLRRVQTRTWPVVVDDLVNRHYAAVLREVAAVRRAA